MKATLADLQYLTPLRIPSKAGNRFFNPEAPAVQALRDVVLTALTEAPEGTVVVVDLARVVLTGSCHAAVLGAVLAEIVRGQHLGRYLVVHDPDGNNEWDADAGLRKESENINTKLVCVWRGPDDKISLLGSVDKQVQSTYDFVTRRWQEEGGATARDLAQEEGLSIQAASNRMTKAAKLGIIYRAEEVAVSGGGVQNVYRPVR